MNGDTIVAPATPTGHGGIAVIRVSGPAAASMAVAILGRVPEPRRATFARFCDQDGAILDDGIALFFLAPRSFTGEDVLELQGHGGPVVVDQLVNRLLCLGGRLAEPGEFSRRAFLNGKLDLTRAEAIADLINASTVQAMQAARRALDGEFSNLVNGVARRLIQVRIEIEAQLDFPEEDIEPPTRHRLHTEGRDLLQALTRVIAQATQGALLREGIRATLAGRPNVGKSSLMNRLSRRPTAIVSASPGTTRDTLTEEIRLAGARIQLTDTAGLRDQPDEIEAEGIRRAKLAMAEADVILLVTEPPNVRLDWAEFRTGVLDQCSVLIVANKIDYYDEPARLDERADPPILYLSAKTGAGIELLEQRIAAMAGAKAGGEAAFTARRRHLVALEQAKAAVAAAVSLLEEKDKHELAADALRQAQDALGEIVGTMTSDELLGEIFAAFCVGK